MNNRKNQLSIPRIIVCRCDWDGYHDYRLMTTDGLSHLRLTIYPTECLISDLYVHPSVRKQGRATMLLDKAETLNEGLVITIVPNEDWKTEWYRKRGYIILPQTNDE